MVGVFLAVVILDRLILAGVASNRLFLARLIIAGLGRVLISPSGPDAPAER